MAVTIASIFTNANSYFGNDTSERRVTNTERLEAATEACVWLQETLGNDHGVDTYEFEYLDTINYYKVTTAVSDLLTSSDLRKEDGRHFVSALPKSSREVAADISNQSTVFAWAIDRHDNEAYIAVTLDTNRRAEPLATFDSATADGGTWVADTTGSDATNVTFDEVRKFEGSASLNFDVDVSQSVNNYARVYNTSLNTKDLSNFENTGRFLLEFDVPLATYISSLTLAWGTDASNCWSLTKTTDIDGSAIANGRNTMKFNWEDSSVTGAPDVESIVYVSISVNYTASQADDTDFRIDDLRIVNPEPLTFYYNSWNVGTDATGADITAFTATTDIPFYSGQYDQYKYAHAHKTAAIMYRLARNHEEATAEDSEATSQLKRIIDLVPSSKIPESHAFKVAGLNFNRRFNRRVR
jgi:hypothetical protein